MDRLSKPFNLPGFKSYDSPGLDDQTSLIV